MRESHGRPVLGGPALSWAFLLGTSSGFSWWLFKDPLVSPAEGGRDEPLSDKQSVLSVAKAHCPGKRIASKYSSVNWEKRIPSSAPQPPVEHKESTWDRVPRKWIRNVAEERPRDGQAGRNATPLQGDYRHLWRSQPQVKPTKRLRLHWKITQCLPPLPHPLPLRQEGSSTIDTRGLQLRDTDFLYRAKRGGESKDPRGIGSLRYLKLQQTLNKLNAPSQISMKPPTEDLLTELILPDTTCLAFKKAKGQEKVLSEER